MEKALTIKDLYDYCKEQGCENAEMEIEYEYGCYDGNSTETLYLSDFELKKYKNSFDNGKTWADCAVLTLHYYK